MSEVTLTGGVEAALTTKDTFRDEDCAGLAAKICLAASAEEVIDEDDSTGTVAISLVYRIEISRCSKNWVWRNRETS